MLSTLQRVCKTWYIIVIYILQCVCKTYTGIREECWNTSEGTLHRDGGPAKRVFENNILSQEEWFINGKRHRVDGPAFIVYFASGMIRVEEWFINGKLRRDDGPAYIEYYESGNKRLECWYIDNCIHRVTGPSVIEYNEDGSVESEEWFINDKKIDLNDIIETLGNRFTIPLTTSNQMMLKLRFG